MGNTARCWWPVVLVVVIACGGGAGSYVKQVSNNGQMTVTFDGEVPVFDWKPCTAFALRRCPANTMKVVALNVGAPINCKSASSTGTNWSLEGTDLATDPITPPVRYGVVPAGVDVKSPARPLTSGCRYRVFLHVLDGDAGINLREDFCVGNCN